MKLRRFAIYGWIVLGYNILVILWGAFVRATGSGAGCGSHWPLCNGQMLPWSPQIETLIEFTHRLTSGLALVAVIILLIWAFRAYSKRHPVRLGATLSIIFMMIEALIGAVLVLFELVAYNPSAARAFVVGLHLMNTYILLAALALTAWWASGGQPLQLRAQGWLGRALGVGFVGILLVGASGAIAALGNTLFPAESLVDGIRQDFSSTAHFLIRLRVSHPVLAIFLGAYILLIMNLFNAARATATTKLLSRIFLGVYLAQLIGGALNIVLLAPVWLQLLHLLTSDLILIIFVLFMASALAQKAPTYNPLSQPATPSGEKIYG